ncbi:tyrosine-type recombinase/integrase [Streptomyces sp. Wh19]|uniref:tyrosine-type recombinase/integrase n=1 Tax=Streptomyces sp. Wh19 TaxID=3076629 RepID=UPI002958B9B0|nr:tyrosine-type recombinase/integrase [Streptomyces sp. Wh19]MDV9194593.1 tyrosine-type recombinase/integrase [Streptomyces sp. Wh19]
MCLRGFRLWAPVGAREALGNSDFLDAKSPPPFALPEGTALRQGSPLSPSPLELRLRPCDEEVENEITTQQQRVLDRWPSGSRWLFPAPRMNPDGTRPLTTHSYRGQLDPWLERCDVRDEHGRAVHLTPHQWRHTFGTRLINRDVPQEVVRVLLDHSSGEMTAHYARLHDTTVRRHWEKARKVNIQGESVTVDPQGPLAEATWAKQRLGRVTQALPNGYCGLPVQKTCPHANACLTCPMFVTTPEFLPQHREQRQQLLQIVSAAEARGQARVVEMNRQVLGNLEKIITGPESDPGQSEATADAS